MNIRLITLALALWLPIALLGACDKGKGTEKEEEDTVWTWDRCSTEGWDQSDYTFEICDSILYFQVQADCEWDEGAEFQEMRERDTLNWRTIYQRWRGLKKLSPRIKDIYWARFFFFEYGPSLTELPAEIWEIPGMRTIRIRAFPNLRKLPDITKNNELEEFFVDSVVAPFPKGLRLTQITRVEWSRSKLDTLSEELRELAPQLKRLDIVTCSLDSLPHWISEFHQVSVANIIDNELTSIPEGISSFKLGYYDFSDNKLTRLPEGVCKTGDYGSFSATGNHLCTADAWPSCYNTKPLAELIQYQNCP